MLIQGWGACGIDIKVLYMLHGNHDPQVDTLSQSGFAVKANMRIMLCVHDAHVCFHYQMTHQPGPLLEYEVLLENRFPRWKCKKENCVFRIAASKR